MAIVALDKTTIKQITTTQVITSVYSAVKELVENAIDGGGNQIDVYLEDKGLAFIEIKDNGRGISKVDSVYMARPSYTSKISSMSDLESLKSYGFRGEALNSLCKVSDVKIITRTHEDDHARCYTLSHDGNIDQAEFCNRSLGTTVQARSLFKNFPVRRQIISSKKKAIEDVKLIENLLQEFGICRPELRINYRVDETTVFTKIPADSEEETLGNVFGRKFANQYKLLNFSDEDVKIGLMIPKQDLIDLSGINRIYYSHVFVNCRPVVIKEFEKAIFKVLSAHFGDKISTRKKPPFFLNITTSPSAVDVNLEPNKTSVLLVNQSSIIETITDLLSDYYEITLEPSQLPSEPSASSSGALNDSICSASDSEVKSPSPKKRKISKQKVNSNTEDKENIISNGESAPGREDPRSQLPEVNLGPDFSTQEINALPTLDEHQIEALQASSGPSAPPEDRNLQITESQWSKGHVPVNFGGTDVSIININTRTPELMNRPSSSTNPEANKNGFMLFSKEMRPRLIRSNPEVNLVQIAKLLGDSWKGLNSEEREHYRVLGMQEESSSRSRLSPAARPKIPKSRDSAANKKRLLSLLEHMKEKESTKKSSGSGTNIVPWEINMQTLISSFRNLRRKNTDLIVGEVDDKLWIARTNMQLWCLDVQKLFEGLEMKDYEKIPEVVEQCLQRWLKEKDSMDLMQPIFELSSLKED